MISYLNTILTFRLRKEAPFRPYSKMCAYLYSTLLKYLLKNEIGPTSKNKQKIRYVLLGSNPIFQLYKIKLDSLLNVDVPSLLNIL